MAFFDAARWLITTTAAALAGGLLSPERAVELLAVLAHDQGGWFQANADGNTRVDVSALCGDPPDDVLRCQYHRLRH